MYQEKDTIIYLDNVELGYGDKSDYKPVLRDVSLVEKDVVRDGHTTGQTIAIVGRSGSGKSTLFRALAGLVKPKRGKILITDVSTADAQDAKVVSEGDVGYVDQKYTLFRHMTVFDALMAAQWKSTKSKAEKKETVEKYLHEWGLYNQRNQYPCELSGGQRQRTAIMEQMLCSGHFMVLDEPFSGLDVGNVRTCKKTFDLYYQAHELNTIIFSTHDMKLAVDVADSIYVIGKKEGYEDCSTLLHHFDLKKMGMAWSKFGPKHLKFMEELEDIVANSQNIIQPEASSSIK